MPSVKHIYAFPTREVVVVDDRPIDVPQTSSTRWAKVLTIDGRRAYSAAQFPAIPDTLLAQIHVVNAEDVGRADIISRKHYGTQALWWVVCHANDIIDPFAELTLGQVLYLPNYSDLQTQVLTR
jgi:hypothetical protein